MAHSQETMGEETLPGTEYMCDGEENRQNGANQT